MSDDRMILVGKVLDSCHEVYRIEIPGKEESQVIKASLSGKIRFNKIRILPNDMVRVAFSVYDTTNAQIVERIDARRARKLEAEAEGDDDVKKPAKKAHKKGR